MRLKSFLGNHMKEVLASVRDSLGDEAIIISTREESDGRIRITAAIDERDDTERRLEKGISFDQRDSLDLIEEAFFFHGVPLPITDYFMDKIADFPSKDPGLAISSAFENRFTFSPIALSPEVKNRPLFFLGQPGVGKTFTISKLATKASMMGKSVSIITLDTLRAGATEQLANITKLLNIELLSLEDLDCLEAAIDVYNHTDLILIDSPGINPFQEKDMGIYQSVISEIDLDPVFVLPSGIDPYEAQEITASYLDIGASKMLMTKLDLTRRYGSLISAAFQETIQLTNFSDKQDVTADLDAFNPLMMTRLLFSDLEAELRQGFQGVRKKRSMPRPIISQQDRVKEMPNHTRSNRHTNLPIQSIAIASGKGGVGKTLFSVSLAQALSQLGYKILLFDGDLGLANVDIQLGLMPEKDLSNVISGKTSLVHAITHYKDGGFDILAGHSGSGSLATLSAQKLAELKEDLFSISRSYDFLLIDLGAGVDRPVRQLSTAADAILVLTTEEPTALTDAYAFVKLTHTSHPDAKINIVINRAKSLKDGERTYGVIQKSCQNFLHFTPELSGIIRDDPHVSDAIRHQSPLLRRHPDCMAAQDIKTLANHLLQQFNQWEIEHDVA
ncbi:MAG: AAA family ATPase [Alphaproteobacteria bacterium]|jgi:flagellar biosynthesis protein FlhG|nr:AAA family ATPase [Alphaproteobacteria bacterium]MBP9876930.1 AAA family ATPase [Alphaproteobacteria bacterium]